MSLRSAEFHCMFKERLAAMASDPELWIWTRGQLASLFSSWHCPATTSYCLSWTLQGLALLGSWSDRLLQWTRAPISREGRWTTRCRGGGRGWRPIRRSLRATRLIGVIRASNQGLKFNLKNIIRRSLFSLFYYDMEK